MSYIVTVLFDTDVQNLERVEREHPEYLEGVMAAAKGRMIGHTRYVRDGATLDIDEYESEEAYRAFIAEAAPHIERYGAAAGAKPVDTLWRKLA